MKKISLLGSTGSIGTQSLDVCEMHGYDVKCLTANSRVDIMEEQVRKFKPDMVCMMSEAAAKELKSKISDTNTKVVCGMDGLIECATYDKADTVLNSVVGMVGLQPTLEAIKAKKTLALANKETLVAGGHLVTNLAKENGVQILPVDSEHSAIFQSMQGMPNKKAIKKNEKYKRKILITINAIRIMEAPPRFELGHKAFAELCLTTWLWCHIAKGFK